MSDLQQRRSEPRDQTGQADQESGSQNDTPVAGWLALDTDSQPNATQGKEIIMTDLLWGISVDSVDDPIADLTDEITIPRWIDQEISPSTVAAILQGGCASGAYTPAVTYHDALETMRRHGDSHDGVLQYLEDLGELPDPLVLGDSISWSELACLYVSCAVELWASNIEDDLRRLLTT